MPFLWNSKATSPDDSALCAPGSEWFASLIQKSTRGRSLAALELFSSARSDFFFFPLRVGFSINKRSLSKLNTPMPDGLMCVSEDFLEARVNERSAEAWRASGKSWCIHPMGSQRMGVWEQEPKHLQASWLRVFIHNEWNKLLDCLGIVEEIVLGSQRASRNAAYAAGLFSVQVRGRHLAVLRDSSWGRTSVPRSICYPERGHLYSL